MFTAAVSEAGALASTYGFQAGPPLFVMSVEQNKSPNKTQEMAEKINKDGSKSSWP